MPNQPRRVFQFDGQTGGILSVAERPTENSRVLLIISNGEQEAQIFLSREDFEGLCDLRRDVKFGYAPAQESTQLKAVV